MGKKEWESYFDAVRKQNWESARTALAKIVQKEKGNPQVHLKMGDLFQRLGDPVNAVASYHKCAALLEREGFRQKSVALYKIILRLDPNDEKAIYKIKDLMMEVESESVSSALPNVTAPAENASDGGLSAFREKFEGRSMV